MSSSSRRSGNLLHNFTLPALWSKVNEMEKNYKTQELIAEEIMTTGVVLVQKLDFSVLWSLHFGAILGGGDQKDYKIGHFRSVKIKSFPPYARRVSYFLSTKDVKSHIF